MRDSSAFDYCRWLTRVSRSHFDLGLRLLPGPRRQAMQAVYAFCRAVDDVVDWPGNQETATAQLKLWRNELRACLHGFPVHPIAVALAKVIGEFQIPAEHFEAVIAGCEMDVSPRRYRTFEELRVYCERVACAVGLISIRIFGCRHPASSRYAISLGIALQLTNILRDIRSDAARGRVYLPLEEMERFGVSEAQLKSGRASEPFRNLMAFQAARARSFFEESDRALRDSREAGPLTPARIMGGVYRRLLERIELSPFDVFSHRTTVPKGEQLLIALRECVLRRCLPPLSF